MTWLIWRQHRGEALGAVVVLALLGLLVLLHGIPMHDAYDRDGVAACQRVMFGGGDGTFPESCFMTLDEFEGEYATLPEQFAVWLPFLPMLAGMLIGAPLLAREFEQGTWRLVWTQGVTRTRWLATKLAMVLGGVAVFAALFAAAVSWWFGPLAPHPFTQDKFNQAVPVFTGYVLVAVAIGILAGVIVRRTIVAAAITIPAYLAIRIPVEFLLRPRYMEQVITDDPSVQGRGWVPSDIQVSGPVGGGSQTIDPFGYHPADRFWDFQLIESAILVGITVVLLVIAWRLVLGRRAPAVAPHAERELEPIA
jgi:hypothetical protein